MKTTILDDYIGTCLANQHKLHVYGAMNGVLKAAPPVAHLWETDNPLRMPLPISPPSWPDTPMCLCVVPSITPGYYKFCIDQGTEAPILEDWIEQRPWSLEGLLVYPFDDTVFDVIPLAKHVGGGAVVMPEIQLHFTLKPDGWRWRKATTGQVNAFFHNVMLKMIDDKEAVDDDIHHLGEVISYCLGTYLDYIKGPGGWQIHPAREPKLKLKDGKVKKVYQAGSVGYKQFMALGVPQ